MSEGAHNPSQVESNTINYNTMVGGGKLSFEVYWGKVHFNYN